MFPHTSNASIKVQHVVAPNTVSGNPRRLYLVIETEVRAVDEGYAGASALHRVGIEPTTSVFWLPAVRVAASEYNRMLQVYGVQASTSASPGAIVDEEA